MKILERFKRNFNNSVYDAVRVENNGDILERYVINGHYDWTMIKCKTNSWCWHINSTDMEKEYQKYLREEKLKRLLDE